MLRRYGIHGVIGVGGLSPILGVSCPGGAGCTYELLARFNVANQGYANAQVLGIPEGVDVGQLTVVDTSTGTVTINANQLRLFGSIGWDTTGTYSQGIAKSRGKLVGGKVTIANVANSCTWGLTDAATIAINNRDYAFSCVASVMYATIDDAGLRGTILALTPVNGVQYEWAIVLGGYDASEVPWDSGEAGTFDYGAAWFIKGGVYADWTLMWRDHAQNVATLYEMQQQNQNTNLDMDDLRVPTRNYSAVLQPTNKSTFTAANGTSLDAITPEVGGAWTERNGDWDIQGNKANVVNDTGSGPYAMATCGSGEADVFVRGTVNIANSGVGQGGLLFRYTDTSNFWQLLINQGGGEFQLWETNGGVATKRASAAVAFAALTDYEVTIITNGQNMQGFAGGANRLTWTSAFNQAMTVHGIKGRSATTTIDNFHVHPIDGYTELDNCP